MLSTLLHSWYSVRGNIQAQDDGENLDVPVLSEIVGPLSRMCGRPYSIIYGGLLSNTAYSRSKRPVIESLPPLRESPDVLCVLPTTEVLGTLLVARKREGVFCRQTSLLEYGVCRKAYSIYLSPSVSCVMSVSVHTLSVLGGRRPCPSVVRFPG